MRRLGRKHGQESVITKDKDKPARLHDTESKKTKTVSKLVRQIGKHPEGKSMVRLLVHIQVRSEKNYPRRPTNQVTIILKKEEKCVDYCGITAYRARSCTSIHMDRKA